MSIRIHNEVKYRTYWLEIRMTRYGNVVLVTANKMSKLMTTPMKSNTFDQFSPIYIMKFLCIYKLSCNTTAIKKVL